MDPFRSLKGVILILIYSVSYINGEIRCYCNESKCVTSSYMCKSQLGMCYSHVKINEGVKTIVSGCADSLLQEPRMRTCAGRGIEENVAEVVVNETNVINESNGVEIKETTVIETVEETIKEETVQVKNNNVDTSESGLNCCTQDMCNYRDSNEITITIDTQSDNKGQGIYSKRTDDNIRPQKDLWFKAAVIAVPIAGGFILILLVLLAVRMLRTDSRQHKRLIQIRRERSLTKAQLYVTDHFVDKDKNIVAQSDPTPGGTNHSHNIVKNKTSVHHNSQNSKRDHIHSSHRNSQCQSCRHHHHHHKQCQPKLTTYRDGHAYEQIVTQSSESSSTNSSPCEHTCHSVHRTSPYPSVIVWGKSKQADGADVV